MATLPNTIETLNVTDKTMLLSLFFGKLGNSKKVPNSEVEVDADKDLIHVSKTLLESKEYDAVIQHRSKFKNWLKDTISLPGPFRVGMYLIPIAAVEEVETKAMEAFAKDQELIDAFMAVYEDAKEKAKGRLKGTYDPTDYPPAKLVRNRFTFEWAWLSFSTPTKLKEISMALFEAEKEKAAVKLSQATEEITLMMRATLKEMVDHLIESLKPGEDGKKKRFYASTVDKMKEFLANFSIRNVTDDQQLEVIVKTANDILSGVDAEVLRKNEGARDGIKGSFEVVKQYLDQLVVDAGSRSINLDEVEEEASVL